MKYASLLMNLSHPLPGDPYTVSTNGVNVPFSIIHDSFSFLFPDYRTLLLRLSLMLWLTADDGLNIRTS